MHVHAPSFDASTFTLVAGQDDARERTDRFVARAIGTISRSRVKSLMEEGSLTRDGVVVRDASEPVRAGASYILSPPPPVPAVPEGQCMALDILYEDGDLIVIDKPAGLVVHPAPGNETGTLVNALIAHCGDSLVGIGGERRPGIVHRLDKDTSGVMVAAKTEKAHLALSEAFAARTIQRSYTALCWGALLPSRGDFEGAIGRDKADRKRMAVVRAGGKPALTHYRTVKSIGAGLTLVECRLATGRTHQIRVHFAHAGHPLVGDPVYLRRVPAAARQLPELARKAALDFPRQALHAAELGFIHPSSGEPVHFRSDLPPDFQALLADIA
ncbi:ribosomal RNA large subunit 23S rRNA pseudouridine synthase D [Ameyamaea chiangmaiensis NBRC 103196]|uniref:Pseudouridine synthase n=1 Tax=Ameyamaea chiangmaiensis TaxID=442969 RepID=A0A850PDT5_9PROT|nr:RluA family pseudouridine synthase [Ameyamaea chiangmaiensis]MBS4076030.1 RluA family pseudouridine synthase [Ameyamaea chiangmaiensis]NVN40102.1 RluA family pseudouridine synthase [Ameyamaea chiangmaiensis]GBQ61399.1 ribosomal RNA large subunit 23S rRNA pseudouridine synthase D [Ameyamaea chiangmaiensis NBRC 103196]